MKIILKSILCFIWAIISVLCLAFIFIEGRLLVMGDWLVYDNYLNGFMRYLLRLLIAIYILFLAVLEFINLKKKKYQSAITLGVISLIPFGIITGIYGTNYVDIICFVLMLILVFLKAITIFLERKDF